MSSVSTVASGLYAALRLAGGRPDGVLQVLGDPATITGRFWAIGLCLPSVVGRLLMSWAVTGVPGDVWHTSGR